MEFRSFFESKLVKNFQKQNFQVKDLGVVGWWNLSLASKNNVFSLEKQVVSKFPSIAKESIQKMSYLGFKSQRSNLLITDDNEQKNHPIQGTLYHPTYADYKNHSININLNYLNTDTLIHEHAHMVWNNLPKYKKQIFINWFNSKKQEFKKSKEFVSNFQDVSEDEIPLILSQDQ